MRTLNNIGKFSFLIAAGIIAITAILGNAPHQWAMVAIALCMAYAFHADNQRPENQKNARL